jgi:VanZ family protein
MPRPKVQTVRLIFAGAALGIAVFIAYQSTRPAGDPTVPVLRSWLSYAGHFGVYAVLAFCAMIAAWQRRPATLVAVVFACSGFGLVLEVYQGSVDGRSSTPMDAVSNVLGSLSGAGVAYASLPWLDAVWTRKARP